VGRRLGDGSIELGHTVTIGTRNPKKGEVIQWIRDHEANEERLWQDLL